MRHRAILWLVLVSLALGGCGAAKQVTTTLSEEDLREIEELGRTQLVGVGEGAPPPSVVDRAAWPKTDFSRRLVPLREFVSGGPGRDGIPAIGRPRFVPVAAARFLRPREPVIELVLGGEARAYPLQVLVWHEVVNDRVAGVPVAVTFCPLCYTALVFDRRAGGHVLDFGVSGLLRNSDLVMFDRQTESWWQQFGGRALVGRLAGAQLRQLPARIVAWRDFAGRHPRGLVLSRDTGHPRPYGQNPYVGYDDASTPPWFATRNASDRRLQPKERVIFFERGRSAFAVPISVLRERRVVPVEDVVVRWTPGVASALAERDVGSVTVTDARGRLVGHDQPFWFAVAAFRPDVRIVR